MAYIFGQYTGGAQWVPHGLNGQSGWYCLPLNFFTRVTAESGIQASPNEDFSVEVYEVKLDLDGTMVIQSLLVDNALLPKQPLRI